MRVKKVKNSLYWVCSLVCLFFLFVGCSDGPVTGPGDIGGDEGVYGHIQVQVLDSLGGNSVENVQVELYEENNLLVPVQTLNTGADGVTTKFSVKENTGYQLQCGDGTLRAFSTYQGITSELDGSILTLYSYNVGAMHHIEHNAMQITGVEYSADKQNWYSLKSGFALSEPEIAYIRVSARGTAGIEPNNVPGEPYGIGLSINSPVTFANRLPGEYTQRSIPDSFYFKSTVVFDVSSDITFNTGANTIYISAFDVANNRTELALTGDVEIHSGDVDPAIGTIFGKELISVYNMYPVTFNIHYAGSVALKSVNPGRGPVFPADHITRSFGFVDTGNVYGYAKIQFMAATSKMRPGGQIRGYELYRAEGENPADSDYQLIARKNFGTLNRGLSNVGVHCYNDYNPDVRIGARYHYKVRVFNNTTITPLVHLGSSRFIPNSQAYLAAPEDYGVSSDTTPELSFTITNAAEMMNKAQSFTFTLKVREKALGSGDSFSVDFRYDIEDGQFYVKKSGGSFEPTTSAVYSDGTVSIDYAFYTPLLPGLTYEWDILKPTFEHIEKSSKGRDEGICFSHGNNPAEGDNALNGSFSLTIADDAVNK